jgi:hypothetical protein
MPRRLRLASQAERERQREWIASLPLRERIRFRLWQASGLGMLAAFVALLVMLVLATRAI